LLSFEQQLPREQRSVQLSLGERSLGSRHAVKLCAVPGRPSHEVSGTRWPAPV